MSYAMYSLGTINVNKGTGIKHGDLFDQLLYNCDCMIICIKKNKLDYFTDLINNTQYFIPYKTKILYKDKGGVFENIYEKISEVIIVDTADKWKLATSYGKYDIIINEQYNKKTHKIFKNTLENKLKILQDIYDNNYIHICWYVKRVKEITIDRRELNSIPYRPMISRITKDNKDYQNIIDIHDL